MAQTLTPRDLNKARAFTYLFFAFAAAVTLLLWRRGSPNVWIGAPLVAAALVLIVWMELRLRNIRTGKRAMPEFEPLTKQQRRARRLWMFALFAAAALGESILALTDGNVSAATVFGVAAVVLLVLTVRRQRERY